MCCFVPALSWWALPVECPLCLWLCSPTTHFICLLHGQIRPSWVPLKHFGRAAWLPWLWGHFARMWAT